uniref:Transposase DDE domain-containing protein n=7 Tax=unclassified Candidatus Kentrum TaxID=2643149 RepID=A0A450XFW5_9GAMM|nr:MAG: Transposase DDE domain-containing protein [Candidatus Kentron sp. LPFa]VFK28192.1 MAG: Transposase DDE domain-containing protein [Candidatus Kentron sp. LPFa]
MIPPEENAEFVACMEDVLEVYQRPYDPEYPVVCLDEQPTQLIGETRQPIPMKPSQPQRYDYEYERLGTAVNFMITEPLAGWRKVNVRQTRTAVDLAQEVKELLDVDYPDVEKVVLVWDNLNTHVSASLYKAFEPAEARRLLERLDIHYTPKHGSWLDIAEIELSVFTKQCLGRRISDIETLRSKAILPSAVSHGTSQPTMHVPNSNGYIRKLRWNEPLEDQGIDNRLIKRAYRNRPLTQEEKEHNRRHSPVRSTVERVFGVLKLHYGMAKARYDGLVRNRTRFNLMCIAYNLKHGLSVLQGKCA